MAPPGIPCVGWATEFSESTVSFKREPIWDGGGERGEGNFDLEVVVVVVVFGFHRPANSGRLAEVDERKMGPATEETPPPPPPPPPTPRGPSSSHFRSLIRTSERRQSTTIRWTNLQARPQWRLVRPGEFQLRISFVSFQSICRISPEKK